MDCPDRVLDYFEVILGAWSVWVALIVVGVLLAFRRQIAQMGPLRRFRTPLVDVEAHPQLVTNGKELRLNAKQAREQVDFQPKPALLEETRNKIHAQFGEEIDLLKSVPENGPKREDDTKQEKVKREEAVDRLVSDWAKHVLIAAYEFLYRHIYGTQIELLYQLLAIEDEGSTKQTLQRFFDKHSELLGPARGLGEYSKFLTRYKLVETDRFKITNFGGGFLEYISTRVWPMERPF